MGLVYFKHEDEGDGTYDGQIGHAYLHLDEHGSGENEQDLGFITLVEAARIARENGVELHVDGPSREEWDQLDDRDPRRRLFLDRLFRR